MGSNTGTGTAQSSSPSSRPPAPSVAWASLLGPGADRRHGRDTVPRCGGIIRALPLPLPIETPGRAGFTLNWEEQ